MMFSRFGRNMAVALAACLILNAAAPAAVLATEMEEHTQISAATETHTEAPEQKPAESEKPAEPEKSVESEKPAETEKPEENQKPIETEKPVETEKPGEGSDGSDSETGSGADSSDNTETSGNTEKPGDTEFPELNLPDIELPDPELPEFGPGLIPGETEAGTETDSESGELPEEIPGENLGEDPNFDIDEEVTQEEVLLNETLIKQQHIVRPDLTELQEEFRFTRDASAIRVILKKGARVYEEAALTSLVIGRSYTGSVAYILDTVTVERDDPASGEKVAEKWLYIESGSVRGFVPDTALITGLDAAEILLDNEAVSRFREAECTVRPVDNQALTYNLKTAYEPVVDKVYAVAKSNLAILSDKIASSEDVQIIGTLTKDGLAYILADAESDMAYIESNNVRGFVPVADLIMGEEAAALVKKKGEGNMTMAVEKVPAADNPALYYTLTSIRKADGNASLRKAIVEFALQFQGNPYVWGGTSLTNGTDCSGFVMQIYKQFGYSLPRTSIYQSTYGTQIPVSAAIPGDLLFFAKDGVVHHVAMYIGNGKMVHAKGAAYGIVVSNVGNRAVWATRIIK